MKKIIPFLLALLCVLPLCAQRPQLSKMSPLVRRAALRAQRSPAIRQAPSPEGRRPSVCAFVRVQGDGQKILADHGCRSLAQFGDIHIANIPLSSLASLSCEPQVVRIEAGQTCSATLDTSLVVTEASRLHQGDDLPQAFTGKGVVVGSQDIGFDLTHPTWRDVSLQHYRIKRFWDQLSNDSLSGIPMYVGRAYETESDILAYEHSRDGLTQMHGTHTLNIAAGTGCDSPYRGVAYESDLCLVSNAVNEDLVYVDSVDLEKFTSATDALGFKYIFDYAAEQGKPCVVSFSEGAFPDFFGDDKLYFEVLDQLTGPGRILVASAGNEGERLSYFRKPAGQESAGAFFIANFKSIFTKMRSADPFSVRYTFYNEDGSERDSLLIDMQQVWAAPDSDYVDTLQILGEEFIIEIAAYPNCYNPEEIAYEALLTGTNSPIGYKRPISIELVGREADVHLYRGVGNMWKNAFNPSLTAGELSHSLLSPGSAPAVICVGANSYRTQVTTVTGRLYRSDSPGDGLISNYSSRGPTLDERRKPDVVAPGTLVISANSSFYAEEKPDIIGRNSLGFHEWEGRSYPWSAAIGTSQSTPLVAGIIALWLQANPRLTPESVMGILRTTCRHPDTSISYPNNSYGYGEIDAYRGLLEVFDLPTSVGSLSQHPPRQLHFSQPSPRNLLLQAAYAAVHPLRLIVYSTSGQQMLTETLPAGTTTWEVGLSELPRGVYALQVSSPESALEGSWLIRLD